MLDPAHVHENGNKEVKQVSELIKINHFHGLTRTLDRGMLVYRDMKYITTNCVIHGSMLGKGRGQLLKLQKKWFVS